MVTNSVRVADVFYAAQPASDSRQAEATVVLTGGVRTPSDASVGPVAAVPASESWGDDLVVPEATPSASSPPGH